MEHLAKRGTPIKIKHTNEKTEVFLGGISITDRCLSCDIRVEAGRASGTLAVLLDEIEFDIDGKITEKARTGNVGYLEFCQD